jgi:D-lactate dehydrogenase (cytochrome)
VPRFIKSPAAGWETFRRACWSLPTEAICFNVNQHPGTPIAQQAVERRWRAIHDFVKEFGGSFSAEHGIGQLKVFELERYANPVELDLMKRIKRALDPNNIMNPGKVLRA